ncbi:hypothetical protein S40288_11220 [Stachybotrys chartarum IBT 40288]|nr:hypothetical protein S40288_11220 [Stachybotrys chartarum IBT 40288]
MILVQNERPTTGGVGPLRYVTYDDRCKRDRRNPNLKLPSSAHWQAAKAAYHPDTAEMLKAIAETREWPEYSSGLIALLRNVIQKGVDDHGDGLSDRETLEAFDVLVRRHDNPTPSGSDVTMYGMVYALLQVDFCRAITSEFDFDPTYITYGGPLWIYHGKRKDGRNHEEAMAEIPPRCVESKCQANLVVSYETLATSELPSQRVQQTRSKL